jgi:hypothetical protein
MEQDMKTVEWFLNEFQKQVWFEPNSELDIWIKDLILKAKQMEKDKLESLKDFDTWKEWKDTEI